jgi:hypothetical protein
MAGPNKHQVHTEQIRMDWTLRQKGCGVGDTKVSPGKEVTETAEEKMMREANWELPKQQ